jgi:hypothetical protein
MKNPAETRDIDGAGFHIRDCYVWAEIWYLDSPTSYRECLPENGHTQARRDDDFILLDSRGPRDRTRLSSLMVAAFICFSLAFMCFAVGGYLLYIGIDGF